MKATKITSGFYLVQIGALEFEIKRGKYMWTLEDITGPVPKYCGVWSTKREALKEIDRLALNYAKRIAKEREAQLAQLIERLGQKRWRPFRW